jgi:predicted phosphodiesterase
MDASPSFDEAALQAFDQTHAQALRRIWFLGDVHGAFGHIGPALEASKQAGTLPAWLVFLGDVDIEHQPFGEHLRPLRTRHPDVKFAFIHGNHDADTHAHWACLHDGGDAMALHGRVADLDGIRVAGIGGNFLGRVWAPPAAPTFANKTAAMARGAYGWRNGQRPNPKLLGAVYPDDVAKLSAQRAHILVTHEAPSCHPHGWEALDQLARDMRVLRTFHGHTHDDQSDAYALQRPRLGFDARAINHCCIKNGLGELVSGPPANKEDGS